MDQAFHIFEINATELPDCRNEIPELAGYPSAGVDDHIRNTVDAVYEQSARRMQIRCGYRRFSASQVEFDTDAVQFSGVRFDCNKTIGNPAHPSTYRIPYSFFRCIRLRSCAVSIFSAIIASNTVFFLKCSNAYLLQKAIG